MMKKNLTKAMALLSVLALVSITFLSVRAQAGLTEDPPEEPFVLEYPEEPYYSPDGLTVYNAVPPLVMVDNPDSDVQTLDIAGAIENAEIDPAAGGATFSITYVANGGKDAWDEPCYTFPEEAKTAFNAAAAIWTKTIQSSVPITIRACWANLGSSYILGYSGGQPMHRDFSGAPKSGVWYQGSLANSIVGYDLSAGSALENYDMHITYNSGFSWYYGTDGNTPSGQHDLVSVAAHEIAHGLNFSGTAQYSGGTGAWGWGTGYPNVYDTYMESGGGTKVTSYTNPSTALGTLYTSNDLWWDGSYANAANGGGRVQMYAPSSWAGGSSYSHLNYSTYAGTVNSMMVYAISSGTSQHNPGPVTVGLLQDMGWQKASTGVVPTPVEPKGTITDSTPTYQWTAVDGATQYKIELYKSGVKVYTVWPSSSLCGGTYCYKTPTTTLTPGTYKWRVKAKVADVWKWFSDYKWFTVEEPAPGFTSWFGSAAYGWKPIKGTWNITSQGWYQTPGLVSYSSSAAYKALYPTLTYEVKMKRTAADEWANRLYVRGTPYPLSGTSKSWYNSYMFQYTNDGYYSVWKYVNGVSTMVKGWTSYAGIKPYEWNRLLVTAQGSSLKFYINGGLVWSGTDTSHVTGKVGLGMYRSDTGWNPLSVDWAKLTTTVSAAAVDESLAEGIGETYWDWDNPDVSPGGQP